jgi:predicted metal-dependent HD superfamily phosphohydrolase
VGKAERRWWRFCRSLGNGAQSVLATRSAFAELDRRYGDPRRRYHGWDHVQACLRELDRMRRSFADPAAAELALWFHDAVYDPRAQDNEEASARLAAEWAVRLGMAEPSVRAVRRFVLSTRHATLEKGPAGDEALLADIDLAVLGRPSRQYRSYARRIRSEYAWMPEPEYRAGRAALLAAFLRRPSLYRSAAFRRRYERRARRNLRREIRYLSRRLAGRPGNAAPARRRRGSARPGSPQPPGGRRG